MHGGTGSRSERRPARKAHRMKGQVPLVEKAEGRNPNAEGNPKSESRNVQSDSRPEARAFRALVTCRCASSAHRRVYAFVTQKCSRNARGGTHAVARQCPTSRPAQRERAQRALDGRKGDGNSLGDRSKTLGKKPTEEARVTNPGRQILTLAAFPRAIERAAGRMFRTRLHAETDTGAFDLCPREALGTVTMDSPACDEHEGIANHHAPGRDVTPLRSHRFLPTAPSLRQPQRRRAERCLQGPLLPFYSRIAHESISIPPVDRSRQEPGDGFQEFLFIDGLEQERLGRRDLSARAEEPTEGFGVTTRDARRARAGRAAWFPPRPPAAGFRQRAGACIGWRRL